MGYIIAFLLGITSFEDVIYLMSLSEVQYFLGENVIKIHTKTQMFPLYIISLDKGAYLG